MTDSPQITVLPVTEESFYPDLGEAIAVIGDTFTYQVCEERPLELPDASDIGRWLIEFIAENSALLNWDIASSVVSECSYHIDLLIEKLRTSNGTAWYPTGPELTHLESNE